MSSKRQTIWLVSMLGLMVILSAYYLLTDPVDPLDVTTDTPIGDEQPNVDDSIIVQTDGIGEEDVLEHLRQNEAGQDVFIQYHLQRREDISRELERLYDIVANPHTSTEELTRAWEDIDRIETHGAMVMNLEKQLDEEYNDVVILEEHDAWNIIVQSEMLDASQADRIVMKVTESLNIAPHQVKVQYLP